MMKADVQQQEHTTEKEEDIKTAENTFHLACFIKRAAQMAAKLEFRIT